MKHAKTNLVHNQIDISEQKYEKLLVIKKAYMKDMRSYWLCLCDCRKEKIISIDVLRNDTTKSCGCLAKEIGKQKMKNNEKLLKARIENVKEGINIAALKCKSFKNNTSGVKGVYWDKDTRK